MQLRIQKYNKEIQKAMTEGFLFIAVAIEGYSKFNTFATITYGEIEGK
jgi:hypothetical protein